MVKPLFTVEDEQVLSVSRPDKNGTVIELKRVVCDRCGGVGGSSTWVATGYTCFLCGGKGYLERKIKHYTPAYEAELEELNNVRAEQRMAKVRERNLKYNKDHNVYGYAQGYLYLVWTPNTWNYYKAKLKAEGCKYDDLLGFYSLKKFKLQGIELRKVAFEEYALVDDRGKIELNGLYFGNHPRESGKFVGSINERLDLHVKVTSCDYYQRENEPSWYAPVIYYHFKDQDGAVYVWRTNKEDFAADVDDVIHIKCILKDHNSWKNNFNVNYLTNVVRNVRIIK